MDLAPVAGKTLRFPPGRVEVRLNDAHRRAYRALYAAYRTVIDGLPTLRDRDFDGRAVRMTAKQLDALNAAFEGLADEDGRGSSVFAAQEAGRTRLFKRLQYLS
jgi:hypothetical protein